MRSAVKDLRGLVAQARGSSMHMAADERIDAEDDQDESLLDVTNVSSKINNSTSTVNKNYNSKPIAK